MLSAAGVRYVDDRGKPVKIVPIIIDPHKGNEDLKRTEALLNDYREIHHRLYNGKTEPDGFFCQRDCDPA